MKLKFSTQFISVLITIFNLGFSPNVKIIAQNNRPHDLQESLKQLEMIDLTKVALHQATFTENDKWFVVTKNQTTNEWNYRLGAISRLFSPCNNQGYNFGIPNGSEERIAFSCPDFSVEVWNLKESKRLTYFRVEKDKTSEYLLPNLSPNSERLIYKPAMLSEQAILRNAITGAEIATLTSDTTDCEYCNRTVYKMEFSPDSKLVGVSFGGMVFVWNTENGEFLSGLKDEKVHFHSSEALSHKAIISEILFSKDSRTIITGSYDGIIKSWNVETGRLLQIFKGHNDRITSLNISPDGQILATGGRDKKFRLWNLVTGKLLLTSASNKNTVKILNFSPDGKKILSMTDDTVFIWETATGKLLEQMHSPGELSTRFSSDWRFVSINDKNKKTLGLYEYVQP
jgi:WD40 repeat protein